MEFKYSRPSRRVTLSIPVILVTGNANEAYLKQALQAGAKGVLAKPFVKEALLDQLGKFLERKELTAALAA